MLDRWFRIPLVGLAVAGLWAATGCSQQAAAIRVGDSHVSHDEFTDQLKSMRTIREVAVEEGRAAPAALDGIDGELTGSFSRTFVTENVQNRITTLLMTEIFNEADLELTGQDRAIERERLEQVVPGFSDLDDGEQDRIVEEEAMFQALQRHTCPDFVPSQQQTMCPDMVRAIEDHHERADIEVSSKLGSWDQATGSLVPPEGPEAQSRDGDALDPNGSPLGLPLG